MSSESNSSTNKSAEHFLKPEMDSKEAIFQEIYQQNQKTFNSISRMESLFINSLELVEQEVAEGNTKTALAYLETYHLCLAINSQTNRFSSTLSKEGEALVFNMLNKEINFGL